jgi:regulatory protein
MAEITRLAVVNGKPSIKVHLDGAYWATLPMTLVADEDLHVGLVLTVTQQQTLERKQADAAALTYAIKSLDFRMASRGQLRDRLKRKGYDEAAIERTLDRCVELGALNDRVLAATRARRFRDAGHAAFSTQQRLRRQGFADDDLAAAIAEVYAEFDEEAEARRLLAARPSTASSRSRAYGFLARRGFSPQIAGRLATEVAGTTAQQQSPVDVDELERQVRRRYPTAATDAGARRRAHAWLQRHGATSAQTQAILRSLTFAEGSGPFA